MANGIATRSSCGHRSICLPVPEDAHLRAANDPAKFRHLLDDGFRRAPNCSRRASPEITSRLGANPSAIIAEVQWIISIPT